MRLRITDAGGLLAETIQGLDTPATTGLAFEGHGLDHRLWVNGNEESSTVTLRLQLLLSEGSRLTLGCAPAAVDVQWIPNSSAGNFTVETAGGAPCATASMTYAARGGFPSIVRLHGWEALHMLRREDVLTRVFLDGNNSCLMVLLNAWIGSQFTGPISSTHARTGPVPDSPATSPAPAPADLQAGPHSLRAWMQRSDEGRRLVRLYEEHTAEVVTRVLADLGLLTDALALVREFQPGLREFLAGNGARVVIRPDMIAQLNRVWDRLAAGGSPALRQAIEQERARFHGLQDFVGRTFAEWGAMLGLGSPESPFITVSSPRVESTAFHVDANRVNGLAYSLWRRRPDPDAAWEPVPDGVLRTADSTIQLTDPAPHHAAALPGPDRTGAGGGNRDRIRQRPVNTRTPPASRTPAPGTGPMPTEQRETPGRVRRRLTSRLATCIPQPGWMAGFVVALLAFAPAGTGQEPPDTNYDESRVTAYELPDPLVAFDGRWITNAAAWHDLRRPEILAAFARTIYGRTPPIETRLRVEANAPDAIVFDGLALRRQVRLRLLDADAAPWIDLLLHLPRRVEGPVPVFLGLNYGNQGVHPDPAILPSRNAHCQPGEHAARWPLPTLLARGYAVASFHGGDLELDRHGSGCRFTEADWKRGIRHWQLEREGRSEPADDEWGALGAWAWGLSRALDYLRTDPAIDGTRVAVFGHSRTGKAALWAGAQDERFALVISNDSGQGGAALARRRYGETVAASYDLSGSWYCRNYRQYGNNEAALPVDAHLLIALMAPRPVYVASAIEDRWADPRGEFLAARHAQPVYELLGRPGLGVTEMPAVDQPVGDTIGYHVRSGDHEITAYDWARYLDFADRHLARPGGRTAPRPPR